MTELERKRKYKEALRLLKRVNELLDEIDAKLSKKKAA